MAVKVWSVGAGKGGVGKTFISSSIAITLSKLGYSTLLIDLDTAGANVHTAIGASPSENTIYSYFNSEIKLENLLQASKLVRLSYIQGVWDEWAAYELSVENVQRLFADVRKLNFDFVIVDLGPGPNAANLEAFKLSDEKILVSTPESTSIEKTYRFFEAFLVNELAPSGTPAAIESLKKALKQYRSTHKKGHFSFRSFLNKEAGFTFDHFESLNQKPIHLVLNNSRSQQDQQLGFSIKSVCNKYYDLAIDYAGAIDFDNAVWQSIRNCEPFLIEKPFTPLSGQFLSICKLLSSNELNSNNIRAVL